MKKILVLFVFSFFAHMSSFAQGCHPTMLRLGFNFDRFVPGNCMTCLEGRMYWDPTEYKCKTDTGVMDFAGITAQKAKYPTLDNYKNVPCPAGKAKYWDGVTVFCHTPCQAGYVFSTQQMACLSKGGCNEGFVAIPPPAGQTTGGKCDIPIDCSAYGPTARKVKVGNDWLCAKA